MTNGIGVSFPLGEIGTRHEGVVGQPLARYCAGWLVTEAGDIFACAVGYSLIDAQRLGRDAVELAAEEAIREALSEERRDRHRVLSPYAAMEIVLPAIQPDESLRWSL